MPMITAGWKRENFRAGVSFLCRDIVKVICKDIVRADIRDSMLAI
jgi:hypothetical protein